MERSGLPTRLIKAVLDLEETLTRDPAASCPNEVAGLLADEPAGSTATAARG